MKLHNNKTYCFINYHNHMLTCLKWFLIRNCYKSYRLFNAVMNRLKQINFITTESCVWLGLDFNCNKLISMLRPLVARSRT